MDLVLQSKYESDLCDDSCEANEAHQLTQRVVTESEVHGQGWEHGRHRPDRIVEVELCAVDAHVSFNLGLQRRWHIWGKLALTKGKLIRFELSGLESFRLTCPIKVLSRERWRNSLSCESFLLFSLNQMLSCFCLRSLRERMEQFRAPPWRSAFRRLVSLLALLMTSPRVSVKSILGFNLIWKWHAQITLNLITMTHQLIIFYFLRNLMKYSGQINKNS